MSRVLSTTLIVLSARRSSGIVHASLREQVLQVHSYFNTIFFDGVICEPKCTFDLSESQVLPKGASANPQLLGDRIKICIPIHEIQIEQEGEFMDGMMTLLHEDSHGFAWIHTDHDSLTDWEHMNAFRRTGHGPLWASIFGTTAKYLQNHGCLDADWALELREHIDSRTQRLQPAGEDWEGNGSRTSRSPTEYGPPDASSPAMTCPCIKCQKKLKARYEATRSQADSV